MEPSGTASQHLSAMLENSDRFLTTVEIETSRGIFMGRDSRKTMDSAQLLAEFDMVDFVSLTDNPGGNPHIRPEVLGQELLSQGREVMINISCKDYNRNSVESRLWALDSEGFSNVLALSGDYPVGGFEGQAQPVFDIDSVGLIEMMAQMNDGLSNKILGSSSPEHRLEETNFFPGCAVSPFKKLEGEWQLRELELRNDVTDARTQIQFDLRAPRK